MAGAVNNISSSDLNKIIGSILGYSELSSFKSGKGKANRTNEAGQTIYEYSYCDADGFESGVNKGILVNFYSSLAGNQQSTERLSLEEQSNSFVVLSQNQNSIKYIVENSRFKTRRVISVTKSSNRKTIEISLYNNFAGRIETMTCHIK